MMLSFSRKTLHPSIQVLPPPSQSQPVEAAPKKPQQQPKAGALCKVGVCECVDVLYTTMCQASERIHRNLSPPSTVSLLCSSFFSISGSVPETVSDRSHHILHRR